MWLSEVKMDGLGTNYEAMENGGILSENARRLILQVQSAKSQPDFKDASDKFLRGVGL